MAVVALKDISHWYLQLMAMMKNQEKQENHEKIDTRDSLCRTPGVGAFLQETLRKPIFLICVVKPLLLITSVFLPESNGRTDGAIRFPD